MSAAEVKDRAGPKISSQAQADLAARGEQAKKVELQAQFAAVLNGFAFTLPHLTYASGVGQIKQRTDVVDAVMSELVDHEHFVMVLLRESTCPLVCELKAKMAAKFAADRFVEHAMCERGEL